MLLSLILTVMAAFMALQSVLMVLPIPFSQWNWVCWVQIALAVVLVVICALSARRTVRIYKKQKVELEKKQAQERARQEAKRRAQYLEEDIDIEKEAEKAEAARLAAEAAEAEKAAETATPSAAEETLGAPQTSETEDTAEAEAAKDEG